MSKEDKDLNEGLADDAALATDLGDEKTRTAEQLTYYGGDPEDDTEDLTKLDRGDAHDEAEEEEADADDDAEEEEADDDAEEEEADADDDAEEEEADADDDAEEEEADDDAEEEEADADDDAEEEEDPAPKRGIPRHRFNEVNTRMRDAEAEIARRDAEKAAGKDAEVEEFDFDAAEEEYMTLLLDGKTKDAGAKRKEIRAAEKADFTATTKSETVAEVDQAATSRALNSLTREAESMFPIFNQKHKDFNPQAVSKTLTFMKGYEADGLTSDDAFVAALADMIDIYDLDTESLSDDKPSVKNKGDDDEGTKKKGKKVTKKKPIKRVKDKLKAAKQQGKSPVGEGKRGDGAGFVAPDIEQMSDEELDALPASTLAKMRGDFVD